MVADANNDDDGSSGSSTRLNTVPSSVPIRRRSSTGNLLMSPFGRRAERYPLRNTPERESRRSGVLSNEVAQERSAAEELQRMREQHAALIASIDAKTHNQRPVQPPAPRPVQPPPPPAVITQTQPAVQPTTRQRRSGSKNYSNDELLSLMLCIQRVLPIGHDMWEMVAQLHAINYGHCQRDAKSIKTKYLRLSNKKPSTGNPNMPQATRLAKEIKIAIDLKVGNTNPDPEDFFQDNTNNVGDDEFSEDSLLVEQHVPREIMATTTAQPNSPRQITAAPAVPFENNTAIGTVTTTKKKTRTNQIVTAMKSTTEETRSSYSSIMEQ